MPNPFQYPVFTARHPTTNVPLEGGKVYFYDAGTTDLKDTYSDSTLQTANTNPVQLDANGEADIYLSGSYKVKLDQADDTQVWVYDNITAIEELSEWTILGAATYVSATSFTVSGDQTSVLHPGRRVKLADSSTLYGTITASVYGVVTTVTVVLDSGSVTNSLTSCNYGIISTDNTSIGFLQTGTGAKGRSLNDKLCDVVSVKDFGATGDGSTDDTNAIQVGIDAIAEVDGAYLYFPVGDYLITSTLTLRSNLWLDGAGEGTFMDFTTATAYDNLFEFNAAQIDDVRISNMRIRGQSDDSDVAKLSEGCAVCLTSSSRMERFKAFNLRIERFHQGIRINQTAGFAESPDISHCWFDEIAYSCIDLRNCKSPTVSHNTFDLNRTGVGNAVDTIVGVWAAAGETGEVNNTMVRVIDNTVWEGSGESINIQASTATITGNTVDNAGPDAIMFEPVVQTAPTLDESRHVSVISGNVVTNYGDRGITVRNDPANNTRAGTHVVITNNVVETGTQGMRIGWGTATTSGPANILIANNLISDATGASIVLQDASGVTLSGNMLTDSGAQGMNIIDSDNISITGGFVKGSGATSDGIVLDGTDNVVMTGVLIANTGRYGIEVSNSSDNVNVSYNVFEDDQGTPTMDSGVHVTSGTNIYQQGNTVNGNTGVAISGVIIPTLANDATPSVKNGSVFLTGGTTTVTDFDDGFTGQQIIILSEHSITITDGTNIFLNGSANFVMASSDSLTLLQKADGKWYEVSRSVN